MQAVRIERMTKDHIDGVTAVETVCFSVPWTRADFVREMTENRLALYWVAKDNEKIVGFGGMWHIVNEGHITNIAVLEDYRGQGIADALLTALLEEARQREMIGVTLEVRVGNVPAQSLYTKHGFKPEGIRKRYYAETGDDAVIMWKYFPENSGEE